MQQKRSKMCQIIKLLLTYLSILAQLDEIRTTSINHDLNQHLPLKSDKGISSRLRKRTNESYSLGKFRD